MFFAGTDKLENEFYELYSSLFKKKDAYMRRKKPLSAVHLTVRNPKLSEKRS